MKTLFGKMYKNVCRACLGNSDNMLSIYEEPIVGISLEQMFKSISFLEIENYAITENLCRICSIDLLNAYQFQQKCIESLKLIKQYIKKDLKANVERINVDYEEFSDDKHSISSEQPFEQESNVKEKTSKTHKCNFCSKEFPFKSNLTEHIKNHTGEKPYLCSICGKGFRQKGGLDYHMRYHTGYKPFECSVCKTAFMSQNILKVHMRRHTDERPYICDICGRAFRQNTDMRTHRRTQHQTAVNDRLEMIECGVCKKKLSRSGTLTVHMRIHTGERPFKCCTCGKGFITRSLMLRHKRIHTKERPYVCSICERGFTQSTSLNRHMQTHNKNLKESS